MGNRERGVKEFVAWEVTVNPKTGKVSRAVSVDYVLPAEDSRELDRQYREARENNQEKPVIVAMRTLQGSNSIKFF